MTIQQSERECFSGASHGTERAVCKYLHRLGDLVFPKLCASPSPTPLSVMTLDSVKCTCFEVFHTCSTPARPLLHGGASQPPPLISHTPCCLSYPRGLVPGFRQPRPAQWEPQQSQGPVRWLSPNLWALWSLPAPGELTQKVEELKCLNPSFPILLCFLFLSKHTSRNIFAYIHSNT